MLVDIDTVFFNIWSGYSLLMNEQIHNQTRNSTFFPTTKDLTARLGVYWL